MHYCWQQYASTLVLVDPIGLQHRAANCPTHWQKSIWMVYVVEVSLNGEASWNNVTQGVVFEQLEQLKSIQTSCTWCKCNTSSVLASVCRFVYCINCVCAVDCMLVAVEMSVLEHAFVCTL